MHDFHYSATEAGFTCLACNRRAFSQAEAMSANIKETCVNYQGKD